MGTNILATKMMLSVIKWGEVVRRGCRPECGQTWEEKLFCIKEREFRISLDSLENLEEWGVSREVHKPCVDCVCVCCFFLLCYYHYY